MAEAAATTTSEKGTEECYICKNVFNKKSRRPKILPCGHNVCAKCISELVKANAQTCPFCGRDFECKDANEFPTNLNVAKRVKSGTPSKKPKAEIQTKKAESSTTEKDSDVPEDCDICNYAFTKSYRCPKILPCGHTICAHCINTLVKTNPNICPKCRKPFDGRDARDFATHMAVIHKITRRENKPEMTDLKDDSTAKTDPEDDDDIQLVKVACALKEKTEKLYQTNLTKYDNADLDIQKEKNYILELKESLLALNVDIESVMNVLKEVKEKNNCVVFYLEGVTQFLQYMQIIKTERVKTNEEKAKKFPLSHNLASLGPLGQTFKELHQNAKGFEKDLKAVIIKSEEIRISVQKDQNVWRENIDKIQAISSFKEEGGGAKSLKVDLSQELAEMKSEYDFSQQIKVDDLREMSDHIREKIEERKVFVRQRVEEEKGEEQIKGREEEEREETKAKKGKRKQKQRIGPLSITNEDWLILHHMKEEDSLSPNSYVVEYSEIMQMVDPSSRYTFIDVEMKKKNFEGRVFFRLSPDTAYGREVFLMSSGEMGTSYAEGNRHIQVLSKGSIDEFLFIFVNETKSLKDNWGNELEKEEYKGPQVAGTLCGYYVSENHNGVFICTKDNPQMNLFGVIGKVYKGFEVVERLCSFAPGRYKLESIDCRIKDCGVVIRL